MDGLPTLETEAIRQLAEYDQWICWKIVTRNGKPTKVPIDPKTGFNASVTSTSTWGSFEVAYDFYISSGHMAGLGFVFSDADPFSGIDLDKCFDKDILNDRARAIVDRLASYTEKSPSGNGLHIIIRGSLEGTGKRRGGIEVYSSGRFFTVTGEHIYDTSERIQDRQASLDWLVDTFLIKKATENADRSKATSGDFAPIQSELTGKISADGTPDYSLLILTGLNSYGFYETYTATIKDKEHWSPSEWDQSLANYMGIADWPHVDQANAMIMMRRVHGWQPKLRSDYYARTIFRALDTVEAVNSYEWLTSEEKSPGLRSDKVEARSDDKAGASASSTADAGEMPPRTGSNFANDPERVKALEEISKIFRVKVIDIIRFDIEPDVEWEIETEIRSFRVTAIFFSNPQDFTKSLINNLSVIPVQFKRKQFLIFAQKMLDAARLEHLGEDVTERGQMRVWLESYIETFSERIPSDYDEDAVRIGTPFRMDDHIWINLSELSSYLLRSKGVRMTTKALAPMMRKIGSTRKQIPYKDINGEATSRTNWQIPREIVT